MSRYIHLNPVKASLVQKPEEYLWSSYKDYLAINSGRTWLYCEYLLNSYFPISGRKGYQAFVNEGSSEFEELFYSTDHSIMGDVDFQKNVTSSVTNLVFSEEVSEAKKLKKLSLPLIEQVVEIVSKYYGCDRSEVLLRRPGVKNKIRDVAIYVTYKATQKKLSRLQGYFNLNSYTSVSQVIKRVQRTTAKDKEFAQEINLLLRKAQKEASMVSTR